MAGMAERLRREYGFVGDGFDADVLLKAADRIEQLEQALHASKTRHFHPNGCVCKPCRLIRAALDDPA